MSVLLDIVREVATRKDVSIPELPPLYDTMDPELLQEFVESPVSKNTTVEFTYCEHFVTVAGNGDVKVTPATSNQSQRV